MERYADGDARAFDALYEALAPVVRGTLRRWLIADDRVADAAQSTWLKLHASRGRYRRGAPVVPWVLTIARNVALDRLRSGARKERPIDEAVLEEIPDEAAPVWSKEDEQAVIDAVRQAVTELPPSMAEVIRLHKLEERPMAEVAEILGIREGAARVRAHRGYKALARLLGGLRSEEP